MERNKVTTLSQLQFGDRFYKAGDQKKKVWTVLRLTGKNLMEYQVQQDGDPYPRALKGNAPVVFLRSAQEPIAQS